MDTNRTNFNKNDEESLYRGQRRGCLLESKDFYFKKRLVVKHLKEQDYNLWSISLSHFMINFSVTTIFSNSAFISPSQEESLGETKTRVNSSFSAIAV